MGTAIMRNFVCQWNWRGSVGPPGTRSGEEPGRPRGGAANRCGGRGWSALESIEDALAQCLELTEKKKLDVEACVAQYPQWESELGEILRLPLAIRSLDRQPVLPPELVSQIRERIFSVRDHRPKAGSYLGPSTRVSDAATRASTLASRIQGVRDALLDCHGGGPRCWREDWPGHPGGERRSIGILIESLRFLARIDSFSLHRYYG